MPLSCFSLRPGQLEPPPEPLAGIEIVDGFSARCRSPSRQSRQGSERRVRSATPYKDRQSARGDTRFRYSGVSSTV